MGISRHRWIERTYAMRGYRSGTREARWFPVKVSRRKAEVMSQRVQDDDAVR